LGITKTLGYLDDNDDNDDKNKIRNVPYEEPCRLRHHHNWQGLDVPFNVELVAQGAIGTTRDAVDFNLALAVLFDGVFRNGRKDRLEFQAMGLYIIDRGKRQTGRKMNQHETNDMQECNRLADGKQRHETKAVSQSTNKRTQKGE
jgi:hypothetical protein